MKRRLSLALQRLQKIWTVLGWRKAALIGGVVVVSAATSVFLQLRNNPQEVQIHETATPSSQQVEGELMGATDGTQAPADASSPQGQTPASPQPSTSTPVATPKKQHGTPAAPPGVSANFSVSEILVHAGWESSNATASLSNGEEINGVSKEWNDNSPIGIAMPSTARAKSFPFFITTPHNINPGTYNVKVRVSGQSGSYTANLTVRVLPPLFAFESITYAADLEGFIIALAVHNNFTGNLTVQLSAAPNGTPCSGNQFIFDEIDEETFTFECLYSLSGSHGSYPLTFAVSDGKKSWTKSITWTY